MLSRINDETNHFTLSSYDDDSKISRSGNDKEEIEEASESHLVNSKSQVSSLLFCTYLFTVVVFSQLYIKI